MITHHYRTADSPIGNPSVGARASRGETRIGGVLELLMPEPPSLNQMLDLAKQRTRKSRTGGFMKRSLPVVYDQHLERYELEAVAMLRAFGHVVPVVPWPRWSLLTAQFRLWALRDPTELLASLKWPIDVLVRQRWVLDDSPRQLIELCLPTQYIDRTNRGVTLVIRRDG